MITNGLILKMKGRKTIMTFHIVNIKTNEGLELSIVGDKIFPYNITHSSRRSSLTPEVAFSISPKIPGQYYKKLEEGVLLRIEILLTLEKFKKEVEDGASSFTFGEPKSIEEIATQRTLFHDFQNLDDLIRAALVNSDCPPEQMARKARRTNLLVVSGCSDFDYDGHAWILFEKKGELYEVHATHDSIAPFEWKPEKVLLKELIYRISNGTFQKRIQLQLKEFLLKRTK